MSDNVDFWFDPSCPWTWITSRWLVEVSELRDLNITWHSFSLWELNRGRELDPGYRAHIDELRGFGRVTMGVEIEAPERLAQFYTVLGAAIHNEGADKNDAALAAALAASGLDASILERANAGEYDEALAASTRAALEKVGDDVGVPIIAVGDTAFFGPVMSPAPHGEEAAHAWDGTLALAKTPGFFELKRSRDVGPIFD
ncbi:MULTISPECIES: DsbA family protein [Trueperella]|uniref:mycothiol-dependent nitroreductase Rv2466c family protein n=1 Tax=Trueperella TaxID=1069494 RepID=UPI0008A33367|nr:MULTISPECIES: DsbA family protein [Trueperella]OFS67400.1 disulfide bond formation protein DsbA [Trueperella sp. HMSC08H06]